jgi:hypothetical protein
MYLDQAFQAPDRNEFIAAMQKKISSHTSNGSWKFMLWSKALSSEIVVPAVSAMRRKSLAKFSR